MLKKRISRGLYWTPRILSIIFILFLAMFSLDIFGNGYGFWETILGLLIHNIPVFILAFVLWIAWKREIVGTIVFSLAGVLYIFQMIYNTATNTFQGYMLSYSLIIAGPAFVIAYLFYLNWKARKAGLLK